MTLDLKCSMHIRLSANFKHTSLLVYYSILVDYLPHSCRSWIQQPTATPNNSGCILISIQRVSTWTPEAISPILNTTHLPVQCKPSAIANTTVSLYCPYVKYTCCCSQYCSMFYCRCGRIQYSVFQVLAFRWT